MHVNIRHSTNKIDLPALQEIIYATDTFNAEEKLVAVELVQAAIEQPEQDYRLLLAELELGSSIGPAIIGYICYGKTPMTQKTYDLYWMAVSPSHQGKGVGKKLVQYLENHLQQERAGGIRVETSTRKGYETTLAFYASCNYPMVSRIAQFYAPDDDLVVYFKVLHDPPPAG